MEKIYHYLWKSKMFGRKLLDDNGRKVEVIDPGSHNNDAGPDFFNSKIKIDEIEWVGNVEIHVKASDWYRHGHDNDPAYDNVILHLVGVADRKVSRKDGSLIPQAEITLPEDFFRTLAFLSEEVDVIRCREKLPQLSSVKKTDWIESLTIERLQSKASKILDIYKAIDCNWEQTAFIMLARSLGFGLNGDPFEILARSVPLKILHHHSDNTFQLEAILFGQAGLLDSSLHIFDEYYQLLCREYYFLARKYNLRPMREGQWKMARTRPQNFPYRRIAWLAAICEGGFSIFSKLKNCSADGEEIRKIFQLKLKGYWSDHFSFGFPTRGVPEQLSTSSIDCIIINMVVPIVYAYGRTISDTEAGERAFNILSSLPAENNKISRQWESVGIKPGDAAQSQALIQLKKEYCDPRKCLYCRFGSQILRKELIPMVSLD